MWTELGEEATTHLDDNESALLSEAALRDWSRAGEGQSVAPSPARAVVSFQHVNDFT
jgi:hypothetical protein